MIWLIKLIWIMPGHRRKGYASRAIEAAEKIHGAHPSSLETILQEKGNLRLYEKPGYTRTGRILHINEKMDLVFYEKN